MLCPVGQSQSTLEKNNMKTDPGFDLGACFRRSDI